MTNTSLIVLALALLGGGSRLVAAPISYTFFGVGSGVQTQVGSTGFTDDQFEVLFNTDTSLITPWADGYQILGITGVSVAVSGLESGGFADTFNLFTNTLTSVIGIQDTSTTNIIGETAGFADTYGLNTALPETAGTPFFALGEVYSTSFGSITFSSVSSMSLEVTGGVSSSAPEPGAFSLSAVGAAAALWLRLRRGRATATSPA